MWLDLADSCSSRLCCSRFRGVWPSHLARAGPLATRKGVAIMLSTATSSTVWKMVWLSSPAATPALEATSENSPTWPRATPASTELRRGRPTCREAIAATSGLISSTQSVSRPICQGVAEQKPHIEQHAD